MDLWMLQTRNTDEHNIWGMPGCLLPDGQSCYACCVVKRVEDPEWGETPGFTKIEGAECPLLADADEGGMCCGVYPAHPTPCQNYHCSSSEIPAVQHLLVQWAEDNGLVTPEHASAAHERIG